MKKFQFRLDTVLSYKQQVQEGLQNEHAGLLQKVQLQEQQLAEVQQRYMALNQEFREAEATGMTIAEAMSYEGGLRFLEREIQKETKKLQECRRAAEKKREEVMVASQETMVLERLKEKKLDAYHKDIQKKEEQFIEELVSTTRVMEASLSGM